jgi:hypothetical protein
MKLDVSLLGWKFNKKNIGKKKSLFDCYYCGLNSKKIECGGIFYCPNPRCSGPGGAWFRHQLPSFKENIDGTHTVNEDQWDNYAYGYTYNLIQFTKLQ